MFCPKAGLINDSYGIFGNFIGGYLQCNTKKKKVSYLKTSGSWVHVEEGVIGVSVTIGIHTDVARDSYKGNA